MNLKKRILVSVVIAAYNEEKHISKSITSVQKQSYENLELIVVDDGSTDSTKSILNSYNLRYYYLPHGGLGRARNFGVAKSKGNIIIFVDADMYLHKNYVENIIQPILESKCDGVFTLSEYVANINNIWARCWSINNNLPINLRISPMNINSNSGFRAITKTKFIQIGRFNPKMGYIDDRISRIHEIKICGVNNAICYHYNPDNLIDVFYSARWIGRSAEFKRSLKNIKKYSIINSLFISIKKIRKGAPLGFLLFKIIFDFGILTGLIIKEEKINFSK